MLGTKLIFSITCHCQIDGQTEVASQVLSTLLKDLTREPQRVGSKILKCRFCLQLGSYLYYMLLSFEAGCGVNPLTPMNLIPLPIEHMVSFKVQEIAKEMKKLHDQIRAQIEKVNASYKARVTQTQEAFNFQWLYQTKERFSSKRKNNS